MATKRSLSEGAAAVVTRNKRQRRMDQESEPSFSNLNTDCKVHIVSFLGSKDMNSFAECNRECYQVRSNESLDQERTGTIVWTDRTTFRSFCNKIRQVGYRFTGNRTCIKIVEHKMSHNTAISISSLSRDSSEALKLVERLDQVKSLDLSVQEPTSMHRELLSLFGAILPNLQALDFSNARVDFCLRKTERFWPRLSKVTWKRGKEFGYCGFEFYECRTLTHLDLEGSVFTQHVQQGDRSVLISDIQIVNNVYLLMKCSRLEWLNVKGAQLRIPQGHESQSLSQEELIKMVRHHSALRWLRSDLTDENVALLQRERPDITFVS